MTDTMNHRATVVPVPASEDQNAANFGGVHHDFGVSQSIIMFKKYFTCRLPLCLFLDNSDNLNEQQGQGPPSEIRLSPISC